MDIAFVGTGRMGTELALHLVRDHDVTVWNRTAERTDRLRVAGAHVAGTLAEALVGRGAIISCLFGPDTVRQVLLEPEAIPAGALWLDATTVSPADARQFAGWARQRRIRYVHTPVVGTIGPARAGTLGVYVGGEDAAGRATAAELVRPWADPERLRTFTDAGEAASAKLLANLALAVSLEGLAEALRLGEALGFDDETTLDLLDRTGLGFSASLKRRHVLEGAFGDADFTADALAKDIRLMLSADPGPLPATAAALEALDVARAAGRGEYDVSVIADRAQDAD